MCRRNMLTGLRVLRRLEGRKKVSRVRKEWLRGCGYRSCMTFSIFSSIVTEHQETWNDTVESVNMYVFVYIQVTFISVTVTTIIVIIDIIITISFTCATEITYEKSSFPVLRVCLVF